MVSQEKATEMARKYLSDNRLALREWYRDYRVQETGIPGMEVSFPSPSKMEGVLEEWLGRSKDYLFELICVEWNYSEKRKQKEFEEAVSLIVALADFLVMQHTKIPSPIALASLLVMKGLDVLCSGEPEWPKRSSCLSAEQV